MSRSAPPTAAPTRPLDLDVPCLHGLGRTLRVTGQRRIKWHSAMKITYQDITVEVDIAPIFFGTTSWLLSRWSNEPLKHLRDPVGVVSSRLFALRQGTTFRDPQGVWRAAPLLKPLANGSALPIQSGFPVTGLLDVFGQLAVAHALGKNRRAFALIDDQNPGDLHKFSLMCFGGPTSNGVSDQIFERLSSVIAPHFAWAAGFNGFLLSGETFGSGGDGVVLGYDSPWNHEHFILVTAGLGPAGTRAGAQMLTQWSAIVPSRKQRKARRFVAAVNYTGAGQLPRLRRFIELE